MKHIDLFSGIGGFALAADKVFGKVDHTFVEWDPFCQSILKKHWPKSEIYGDIRQFIADANSKGWEGNWTKHETERCDGQCDRAREDEKPFLLTGGFPCQPFSHAGRRKGTSDDRYLWPEMFRVIQIFQPTWVIAENVRGLVTWNDGMVLETVCADLESEGYEVQPIIIPAVSVGAPHRRDRVWIIANRRCEYGESRNSQRMEAKKTKRSTRAEAHKRSSEYPWERDWREVALATCYDGVDDGLPRKMDGATISAARHRKERLKACGNAIVPQVAMEIMKSIC
jgi:DNA (cytosine-5)-methyltransferase 1